MLNILWKRDRLYYMDDLQLIGLLTCSSCNGLDGGLIEIGNENLADERKRRPNEQYGYD